MALAAETGLRWADNGPFDVTIECIDEGGIPPATISVRKFAADGSYAFVAASYDDEVVTLALSEEEGEALGRYLLRHTTGG